ncbi:MAG: DNA double-strand break repair nuclease NurA [Desulfurococcales archaeon]|nr:DNA double-strand break repair nuclease NurA [Desulfurococcales archaeon]
MSSELISAAARKRDEIIKKIEIFSKQHYINEVRKFWILYEPSPKVPTSIAGVDGSNAKVDFQGFTIYGITAAAVIYRELINGKYRDVATLSVADVDVLSPPQAAERVGLYREILEVKVAIQAMLNGAEYVLMDGSLRSMLITPSPLNQVLLSTILSRIEREFGEEVFDKIESGLTKTLKSISEIKVHPLVAKEVTEPIIYEVDESKLQMIIALEYIEKLAVIRRLISDAYLNGVPVLFVSKTSRSQAYVKRFIKGKSPVTDIMVFQYLTREPGFSKPYLEEKPIKEMPKIMGLKEFYDRLRILLAYIRLGEGDPVLKVEIPYLVGSSAGDVLDDVVKEVANMLKSISGGGYPYPLYEAHRVTYLSRDMFVNVVDALGISRLLTGREVLGE